MKLSPARELARRYAAGDLSLEDYRTQRRDLIDAVCAGTQILPLSQSTPHRARPRRRWRILVPLVAMAAIAAAIYFSVSSSRHVSGSGTATQEIKQSGPQLLRAFLEANNWDDASITHFAARWKQLPARERQAARSSYTYPRVSSQLQEQIVSQKAMLELAPDPKAASAHLAHLRQMADLLASDKSG